MTPVPNQQISTTVVTSNIVSTWQAHKPQVRRTMIQKYGGQGADYMQIMMDMGYKEAVAGEVVEHYEDQPYYSSITVNANVAAPGVNTNISFVLAPENVPTIPGAKPFVRPQSTIMLVKNEAVYKVISVTETSPGTWTVVAQPNSSTTNSALVAGDKFAIISNVWGEGTGQPITAATGVVKYESYLQIIKETIAMTGTELTNQLWFDMREDGMATPTYWAPIVAQADYRLSLQQEGAFLFNTKTTNPNMEEANTQGLIPEMKTARGHQQPTAGAFELADFDDMNAYLDKVYASQEIMGLTTSKRIRQIDEELKDDMKNTMINMARPRISQVLTANSGNDAQEAFEVNYQFNAVNRGGRNWCWSRLMSFDNPMTYNQTGSVSQDYGLFFPIAKKKDGKNSLRNHISLIYKDHNGYNRFNEVWNDGAAGNGLKIGEMDVKKVYMRSHMGSRQFALEQTILLTN